MILENYLKENGTNIHQMHIITNIPESTIRNYNVRPIAKWNIEFLNAISKTVNKKLGEVVSDINSLNMQENKDSIGYFNFGYFDIENRRYIGSKSRLSTWIRDLVLENTKGNTFFDVFAGTGVISRTMLDYYDKIIVNDFLYSNEVIYDAFFGNQVIDHSIIMSYRDKFRELKPDLLKENYFSINFGEKFFSLNDAKIIGEIRNIIEKSNDLNKREKSILIASLIYSSDKVANTVGHYDAYRRKSVIEDKFIFNLIKPIYTNSKEIVIFRKDANDLVRKVDSDVAFIDPPYNSRQYSRFYHVLETLTKWDKPELSGVAMKPPVENMSDYCRKSAPELFMDLITNINSNYIVVTYNNTYNSKSNSSKNKITLEEILFSLNTVGETKVFEKPYSYFNAGKSNLEDHKEYLFITKVNKFANTKREESTTNKVRSPLFYVGDKYKIMPQLLKYFPKDINNYYDVFTGGGSASINVSAKTYSLNDVDSNIIELHKLLIDNSKNMDEFIGKMYRLINYYGLSHSENKLNFEIEELKKEHKKTYFSIYNKESYLKLREDFNKNKSDVDLLYLLLVYGFNHMIRFNYKGDFNLPVGNVDWNKNVTKALYNYSTWINKSNIKQIKNLDFEEFVDIQFFEKDDYLYFDPPYIVTNSEYNKYWDEEDEKRLYSLLDDLNQKGIRWGLSNMLNKKDRYNDILNNWSKKYKIIPINSNYISRFDNSVKNNMEIFVTNYTSEIEE